MGISHATRNEHWQAIVTNNKFMRRFLDLSADEKKPEDGSLMISRHRGRRVWVTLKWIGT